MKSEEQHKLLQRQLKRFAGASFLEDPAFQQFIEAVNDSYKAFEKDKELSEHSFKLSELEFADINQKLVEEIKVRKLSVIRIREALNEIRSEADLHTHQGEEDLLSIVELLRKEIEKRKQAEAEMERARDLAEKANMAKSEFLSVMSHEIRTPLNAVIGMGHLLLSNDPREDQRENLTALHTSANHLLVLVNDILDFSKIEAGKLELESMEVDLLQLAADIVNANSVAANEKRNRISLLTDAALPRYVISDSTRLGQVLTNLISNAVKFTENGRIELVIQLGSLENNMATIHFSVRDTGIGIPAEKQVGIFEPFMQASNSTTRKFGGTGLGLSISQRILELMNSRLQLTSEPGKGSEFYFTLQLEVAEQQEAVVHTMKAKEHDLKGKRILLVEDTQFNVLFATQLLKNWKASVDVAENGAIAVEKVKNESYDLILMDLQMPVMDGYTATETIREFNQTVPIIALTASATSNVKQKVISIGMQDYVTKPFHFDTFYQRLYKYLFEE
jgi:signal transduction histidine kinase